MDVDFDYASARKFLEEKEWKRQAALDERFEQAWNDFRRIAEMIWIKYKPRAIYQWGSLMNRRDFSEISDIDIAIEGTLSAETLLALLGEADAMTELPLDIVQLDKIHPAHAEGIRARGKRVYGGD